MSIYAALLKWTRLRCSVRVPFHPLPSLPHYWKNVSNFSTDIETHSRPSQKPYKPSYQQSWAVGKRFTKSHKFHFGDKNVRTHRRIRNASRIDKSQTIELQKNLFTPTKYLENRSKEENEMFLKENKIVVSGLYVPPAIQNFSEYNFPMGVIEKLKQFPKPTPIQSQGWSIAFSGYDMVGVGQTGSGKTLGYLLPVLNHVEVHRKIYASRGIEHPLNAPLGLVIAPTRELVQQIAEVCQEYSRITSVKCSFAYGGMEKKTQLDDIYTNGADLLVGTPGRLCDFISNKDIQLSRCGVVVLDEADRMLDMGFEHQVKEVLGRTRSDRQTLMWSATWPDEIQQLAGEYMNDPHIMAVGSTSLRANPDVSQRVTFVTSNSEKVVLLKKTLSLLFSRDQKARAIVFTHTRKSAERVAFILNSSKIYVDSVHSGKPQYLRDRIMKSFREGIIQVLVATDVAARGIDIPDLECVINYEMPKFIETYVHRIGRTGRRGRPGLALSMFVKGDQRLAAPLIALLEEAHQPVDTRIRNISRLLCDGKEELHSTTVERNNVKKHRKKMNMYNRPLQHLVRD